MLQGLDDAFQNTPKEQELDYYDPSDPSDRQQIEWRQGAQQPAAGESTPQPPAPVGEAANGTPGGAGLASPPSSAGVLGGLNSRLQRRLASPRGCELLPRHSAMGCFFQGNPCRCAHAAQLSAAPVLGSAHLLQARWRAR